ncbi:FmdB family zinc ribbon protein [Nitrosococcus wardiae]|uniref:Zinc ribbon domain-containing protein n=1 Tax=Nitrosococcus wardiae TaxID=1814290 RepID=A0A4P7BXQ0_9GAMM|nr:zinc ribbon domain-containing protein [Nitrosococcus wardiae]QBQ53900.1 zinc ribbon domain-containing protein [Nitrosococcus wardiae]
MPIYEYRCQACGHEMELLQKIADEPLRECPSCGEGQLRKLVSAVGFRLKGGGWYETDFKNGDKRNVVSSSDGSKDKEDSGKAKDKQAGAPAAKPTDSSPAATSG